MIPLNKPTYFGRDDPKEIYFQNSRVQKVVQRKPLISKSSNTLKSYFHTKENSELNTKDKNNLLIL
jgi:hypothetical protein